MKTDFVHFLPEDFHPSSRVWIYQASRMFSISEALQLEILLHEFVGGWHSHGAPVKGFANLFFGQFIVVMADETATGVSGCSTDSSVMLIKETEKNFKINMFDRQSLAFFVKDKIQLLPLQQLNYAIENNFISADTLYFNNLVATKKEMLEKWIIPVKESWLAKKISSLQII